MQSHAHALKVGLQFVVFPLNGTQFQAHRHVQFLFREFRHFFQQSVQAPRECRAQVLTPHRNGHAKERSADLLLWLLRQV